MTTPTTTSAPPRTCGYHYPDCTAPATTILEWTVYGGSGQRHRKQGVVCAAHVVYATNISDAVVVGDVEREGMTT